MSAMNYITAARPSNSVTGGKFPSPQTATFQSQPTSRAAKIADTITVSQAAREVLATSGASAIASVDAKLTEIQSKDAISRTAEDMDFLYAHDSKLAAICDKERKSPGSLTSSEVDYQQKTIGFVNTMAYLSPAEKGLYDKAVASGNSEAAAGINQIAFIRTMGHMAGGANGTTYDPVNTSITAANIEKYFSHSIVDPSGNAQSQFQALINFLQNNSVGS